MEVIYIGLAAGAGYVLGSLRLLNQNERGGVFFLGR